ncbi:MAG: hypothetical protein GYB33_03760 [Gammaproteobacteria bacterium]|uniref:hypothetical protein n=1 Tax=Pseudomaricurvus alcaniphilus TaxID=1166482 RepID=UPI0014079B2E|nr:hypothetical protein [Pseudomaricurvus alcaniphilus]MBR9909453.1 hypothetical protein [Gammaproteobacteria bacterium]NHN37142.1 hypothetical protein [Pseudomaricurvus alcaniphilus]
MHRIEWGHIIRAAACYFALIFGVGFLLGIVRVLWLLPRLGERWAELLEMPFMALAIYFAASYVVRKFSLPARAAVRWWVGALALLFMLTAELLLAVIMQEQSLADYAASRDPVSGSVYIAMLLLFAAAPRLLVLLPSHAASP